MNHDDAYIHELIEKALFPASREFPHHPDLDDNLKEIVFMPITLESRATLESLVEKILNQKLAKLIKVEHVQAIEKNSGFRVTITYAVRSSNQYRSFVFELNF